MEKGSLAAGRQPEPERQKNRVFKKHFGRCKRTDDLTCQNGQVKAGHISPLTKNKPPDIKIETSKTDNFWSYFLFTSLNIPMSYVYITDVKYQ